MSPTFNYGSFNPADLPPDTYAVLPEGEYRVLVKTATEQPTRDGTGLGLKGELRVVDGPNKDRALFFWINLANKNPKAVEIGQRELASMMASLGLERIAGPQSLVGKMGRVLVKHEEFNGEKDAKVKRWLPRQQQAQANPVVAQSTYTSAAPAGYDDEPSF